jgi:hypothetical protein
MSLNLGNIWGELIEKYDMSASKPLALWKGGVIVASVSASKHPELVIQISKWVFTSPKPAPSTLQVKGFEIWYEFLKLGESSSACMTLRPKDNLDLEKFYALAAHLLGELPKLKVEQATVHEVEGIIEVWIEFWKKLRITPDKKKILGLVGELLAMDRWLSLNHRPFEIWQGPKGGPHDFCGSITDLEVKVTSNRSGPLIHEISSVSQLEIQGGKDLVLLSFRIGLSKTGALSLHQLVERIEAMPIFRTPGGKDWLDQGLKDAGYSRELELELANYDLWDESLYKITNDFPRLVRANLPDDNRVSNIEYAVNFGGCQEFLVSKEPHLIDLDKRAPESNEAF